MNDPAGNPPPSGGFQTGGWYSGYQYWNGTFASQAGVIHPASDQQGAGETVSEEVNAQTNPDNQAFIDEQNAQPVVNPSVTTPSTPAPSTPTPPSPSTPGSDTSSAIPQPEEPIDLTTMFKNLQESSGVTALQDDYLEKERQFIEAKGVINDNPWLSEATRSGREAKLTKLFNERTANIKNDIAMKKADIETQLNLQIKQMDMNSDAVQQNISNLSNLINMGAFDGASGESIAEWTRRTGLSSDIIQSAIAASKKSEVDTQVITSTADSGEVTVSVVNKQTGEIISQNSLGNVGNAENGSGGGSDDADYNANVQSLTNNVKDGYTLREVTDRYRVEGGLSAEDIFRIYNSNSPWGTAKESFEDYKKGIYQDEQA